MECRVIHGVKEKFPDRNAAVDTSEFAGKADHTQALRIFLQPIGDRGPIFPESGQFGFRRWIAEKALVADFDLRWERVGSKTLQPDPFRRNRCGA